MGVEQDVLINWLGVDEGWIDSREGGLFAYLVYWGLGVPERTHVDVAPHLSTPRFAITVNRSLAHQLGKRFVTWLARPLRAR